jgi:hypothetical protein
MRKFLKRPGTVIQLFVALSLAIRMTTPAPLHPQQVYEFYHGTDYQSAEWIYRNRLSPKALETLGAVGGAPWEEYTDFGKGFYTHPQIQYELAKSWAIRAAKNKCSKGQAETSWGIVAFLIDPYELAKLRLSAPDKILQFVSKTDAPKNAPPSRRRNGARMNWLEFVEFNRHLDQQVSRPGDYDWSDQYLWIQGPIWVPRDSGKNTGLPKFDKESQINWLRDGLDKVLNDPRFRRRLDSGATSCDGK